MLLMKRLNPEIHSEYGANPKFRRFFSKRGCRLKTIPINSSNRFRIGRNCATFKTVEEDFRMDTYVVKAVQTSGNGEEKIFKVSAFTPGDAMDAVARDNPNYNPLSAKRAVGWDLATKVAGIAASKLVRKPVPGWIALKAFIYLEDIVSEAAKRKQENQRAVGDAIEQMVAKIIR